MVENSVENRRPACAKFGPICARIPRKPQNLAGRQPLLHREQASPELEHVGGPPQPFVHLPPLAKPAAIERKRWALPSYEPRP